jgi:hypothetical protein
MLPRYLMPHCKQCALTTINTKHIPENQEYQTEQDLYISFGYQTKESSHNKNQPSSTHIKEYSYEILTQFNK